MTQSLDQPTGAPHASSDLTPSSRRSRQILRVLVSFFGLALLLGIALLVRYLVSPRPFQEIFLSGVNLSRPPHYLGSIYGVDSPVGVAVSKDGDRIYISESSGERLVRVFDRHGQEIGVLPPPSINSVNRSPVYLAVGPDGHVLVADRGQHLISVYSPDGTLLSEFIPGWLPLGVRLNSDGTLLVTDVSPGLHRVHQLSFNPESDPALAPTLVETGLILGESGEGPGQLSFPNTAVRDDRGRTYVSDGNNWRIAVWDVDGTFLYNFGAGAGTESVSLPRGLLIDTYQRLYVVDASAHMVKVYWLEGERPQFLFAFGDLGTADAYFQFPSDIAIDHSGRIYIADRENDRVQVWVY